MRDWLVAADDRTGAFEVAALIAEVAGPTLVTVGAPADGPCVVDLASRQSTPAEAAARAAAVEVSPSQWSAHKIDSTLRGNWAAELSARHALSARRVVLLPAWPEMGRTCLGGVVHVHGRPVGSIAQHLPGVVSVADAGRLRAWLAGDEPFAACDLVDDADVLAAAAVVAGADVLVAGPAGPLGAVFSSRSGAWPASPSVAIDSPVLVVCGSANPVSRDQLARLAAARPDVTVMATAATTGDLEVQAAATLAAAARERSASRRPRTIVLIGGDTAAAFLGDEPRLVGGFAAPGMPFGWAADGGGPLVVTKAGGFGGPDALVRLLSA